MWWFDDSLKCDDSFCTEFGSKHHSTNSAKVQITHHCLHDSDIYFAEMGFIQWIMCITCSAEEKKPKKEGTGSWHTVTSICAASNINRYIIVYTISHASFFWQKEKDDVSDDNDAQDKGADDGADDKGVLFGSSLPFSAPDLSGVFCLLDKRLVVKFLYMQQQSVTDHYNDDIKAMCVKDKKIDGKTDWVLLTMSLSLQKMLNSKQQKHHKALQCKIQYRKWKRKMEKCLRGAEALTQYKIAQKWVQHACKKWVLIQILWNDNHNNTLTILQVNTNLCVPI